MSKKNKTRQRRQGDILFEIKSNVEHNGTDKADGIVAYGETTGHFHALQNQESFDLYALKESEYKDDGVVMTMTCHQDTECTHDEHGAIPFNAGEEASIIRQREYDPMSKVKERRVRD